MWKGTFVTPFYFSRFYNTTKPVYSLTLRTEKLSKNLNKSLKKSKIEIKNLNGDLHFYFALKGRQDLNVALTQSL